MRSGIAVVVAAGAALMTGAPARGNEPEPARPTPACSAAVLDDERGDAENAGLDMLGVFLTGSLGDSFANIVVADLDGAVDQPDSTQEFFRLRYRDDSGETQTREARIYADGLREGAAWFDGADGIVQIRLPSLTPGMPTSLLIETGGENERLRVQQSVLDVRVKPFPTIVDRLEAGTGSGACPPKPVVKAPPPPPASEPPAPASRVTAGALRLRGRTLRVPLRSSTRVTDIRGRLTRNGRLVARGRLAELDGRGVLVLTSRRAFRPGTYLLTIPGVIERRVRIA